VVNGGCADVLLYKAAETERVRTDPLLRETQALVELCQQSSAQMRWRNIRDDGVAVRIA